MPKKPNPGKRKLWPRKPAPLLANGERILAEAAFSRLRPRFPGMLVTRYIPTVHTKRGTGDYLLCLDGKWIEFEAKAPYKFATPTHGLDTTQIARGRAVIAAGGIYIVDCDPVSIERKILAYFDDPETARAEASALLAEARSAHQRKFAKRSNKVRWSSPAGQRIKKIARRKRLVRFGPPEFDGLAGIEGRPRRQPPMEA